MKIVQLSISRYRGIRSLEWCPSTGMNCLIGPGDSTKTTVLDAIETGLSPRYGFSGKDSDFYNGDFALPVEIITTLIDLPDEFVSDSRYGLQLRGWDAKNKIIHDEKEEADEYALSIKADLSPETLEWSWTVFNDRVDRSDPPNFRTRDAALSGPVRLGPYAERHLTWGRNSTLTRLAGTEGVAGQLVQAHRNARDGFDVSGQPSIIDAIEKAQAAASRFSVSRTEAYSAKLDVQAIAVSNGAVSLHEGNLPLRTLGTGSSRLLVAGIQHEARSGGMVLVDEVEHGLEPHRLRRLIRLLKSESRGEMETDRTPQVFMTTHSPTAICEVAVDELFAVRKLKKEVRIGGVADGMIGDTAQRHVRGNPNAFLAPRILVCEGRTEEGLMRSLDSKWSMSGRDSFAYCGVAIIEGGGRDPAVNLALHLSQLGYSACVLLDSDDPISTKQREKLLRLNCEVVEWSGESSTEDQVMEHLPDRGVVALIEWAVDWHKEKSVLGNINETCPEGQPDWTTTDLSGMSINPITRSHLAEASVYEAKNAKGKTTHRAWFKSIDGGEAIGNVIFECWPDVAKTPLGGTISAIRRWADEQSGA